MKTVFLSSHFVVVILLMFTFTACDQIELLDLTPAIPHTPNPPANSSCTTFSIDTDKSCQENFSTFYTSMAGYRITDVALAEQQIVGSWELKFITSPYSTECGYDEYIKFESDYSYEWYEEGQLVASGVWSINSNNAMITFQKDGINYAFTHSTTYISGGVWNTMISDLPKLYLEKGC